MNHAKLIETLGGAKKIAAELHVMTGEDLSYDTVRKWKIQGVPWKWRVPVAALAQQQGKALPKQFIPNVSLQLRGVA